MFNRSVWDLCGSRAWLSAAGVDLGPSFWRRCCQSGQRRRGWSRAVPLLRAPKCPKRYKLCPLWDETPPQDLQGRYPWVSWPKRTANIFVQGSLPTVTRIGSSLLRCSAMQLAFRCCFSVLRKSAQYFTHFFLSKQTQIISSLAFIFKK